MPLKDIVVERRRAVYTCDQCRVREQRFYDSPNIDWTEELPWKHDWRLVPIHSPDALAFCSQKCLVAHHDAIVGQAYGPVAEPAKIA